MSYDLGIWYSRQPITTQEASEIYCRLCNAGLPDVEPPDLEPHPNIPSFIAELVEQYPRIEDWDQNDYDNCPWSGSLDVSDAHVLMSLSYSFANTLIPFIEGLAAKYGLVCYNPQWPGVRYPPRLAAMPHLRLSLENGPPIDNPSLDQITVALSSLIVPGNSFAILERTDSIYLQAALQPSGEFIIEYQTGSVAEHYQAVTKDLQIVVSIFRAYAIDDDAWHKIFDWKRIVL